MSWNLVAPNTWSNSNSPYIIKYDNSLGQFIVENVNGENFIPLSDIFNNPAFPVDLSNADVLVKSLQSSGIVTGTHLRSETANTPATPGHSFKSEINSGFFRESAGVLAFSILGNVVGRIGAGYGGFTGNIIQVVSGTNSFQTLISTTSFQNLNSSSGVIWEASIIPKFANSKIFVLYSISTIFGSSVNNDGYGFKILNKVNAGGTYSTIYDPQKVGNDIQPYDFGGFNAMATKVIIPAIHSPSYSLGDTLFYKAMGAIFTTGSATLTVNALRGGTGTNSGHSEIYLLEIAQ